MNVLLMAAVIYVSSLDGAQIKLTDTNNAKCKRDHYSAMVRTAGTPQHYICWKRVDGGALLIDPATKAEFFIPTREFTPVDDI